MTCKSQKVVLRKTWRWLLWMLSSAIVYWPNGSWAEPPAIESLEPPVVQRGAEMEISFIGAGFTECREVVFYSPHLICKQVRVDSEYEMVASIFVAEECRLGSAPFRILGRDGFSELQTLRVTPFRVITEPKRGQTKQVVPLDEPNITLCGVLEEGDSDHYSIALQAGERLSAVVEGVRLGGELLDTVLTIRGPDGRVLEQVDDNSLFQQDPLASVRAAEAGMYTIEVHETNYSGSPQSYYALHVGSFPCPRVAFPAGGQSGTQLDINFFEGRSESFLQTVELPSGAAGFQLFPEADGVRSPCPIPFRISSFANLLESEPNEGVDNSDHSPSIPIAFNGILQAPGDVDHFSFTAKAGEALRIDVFSHRIGAPADTLLTVFDERGQLLARNDDWGSHDSRIDFVPPQSGNFVVRITDKLAAGSPDAVYRIELTRQLPELKVFLPRPNRTSQQGQTIAVARGNRMIARIGVRRELVEGETLIVFQDMPSGVHVSPLLIPADQYWALAIVEADSDARLGGSLCSVTASCGAEDQKVSGGFEQVIDLVAESADQLFHCVTVDRLPIAVAPPLPFSVHLQPPAAQLATGGTVELRIRLERQAQFTAPVRIEFPFLPPGVVGDPYIVIGENASEGLYRLEARDTVAPRVWPIAAVGRIDLLSVSDSPQGSGGEGATGSIDVNALSGREAASELVDLTLARAPVSARFEQLAAEQGEEIPVVCNLERDGELPTRMLATLEGLPNRVTAEPIEVSDSDTQIVFKLSLQSDAPIGSFSSVQCRLTGELNGWDVSYVVAANATLQIRAPGKLFRGPEGQVLSRLEALRSSRP